jgi:hypothetical protein
MRYEWKGKPGEDEFGCRAWTIEKSTGDRLEGIWVDWKMVKAEGWHSKNGSKWKTMPDQMFIYRAAAFWQRAYAPEISMGLSTTEEMADVIDVANDGSVRVSTESLRAEMRRVDAEVVDTDAAPQPDAKTDAETGEIARETPAAQRTQVPEFDGAAFARRMRACTSIDVLDLAADEIREIPADLQAEMRAIYTARRAELERPAEDHPKTVRRRAPINAE